MPWCAIRVSCSELIQDDIVESLKGAYNSIIGYRHYEKAENPHIHLLMDAKLKDDAIRDRIKPNIPNYHKTKLSIKSTQTKGPKKGQPVDIDMLPYLTKGKYDPFVNVGFTEDQIAEAKNKGYIKDDIPVSNHNSVETTLQSSPKKNQVTQHDMVKEICIKMYVKDPETDIEKPIPYDYDLLYEATRETLVEHKKGGDIYYVMKLMESVIMFMYPHTHRAFVKSAWNLRHKISF